jgi:D-alanine-D-alanine ligase
MNKKIRLGLLFGGRSAEHEVSLQSAKSIASALDKHKYDIVYIGITKSGKWFYIDDENFLLNDNDPSKIKLKALTEQIVLPAGAGKKELYNIKSNNSIPSLDVVFPVLHGTYGEDGTVQGLMKLADVPYVGADVTGSAVGMDKDVMKRLLRDAGIPIGKFLVEYKYNRGNIRFSSITEELGLPLFIKPANLGSSVGISRVKNEDEFYKAVDLAFEYDMKIIIEENISGREIECSVLGGDEPEASLPGEVILKSDFYSYDTKYINDDEAETKIPAELDQNVIKNIRELAVKTFKVLCCYGLARVDFFLCGDNKVYVNEINTLPGFTRISMYPKLWEATGLKYSDLLDKLVELAFKRHEKEKALRTSNF